MMKWSTVELKKLLKGISTFQPKYCYELKWIDRRNLIKLKWLQDPNLVNEYNLNRMRLKKLPDISGTDESI
jgi:hypothetical protein